MTNDYQQEIKQKDEADRAFDKAIAEHRLSTNPKDKNFVGFYMYMGKDRYDVPNGKDLFKNIETRQYDV